MSKYSGKLLGYLPILAFFGYWVYACLICAALTREPRMLKLGIITTPLLAVMAAAALKTARSKKDR